MSDRIDLKIGGLRLLLLAGRAAYASELDSLFIADTHFGKEATFRQHGIPVPQGATDGTLQAIAQLLDTTGARRIILLGDMFHARCSLSVDVRRSLQAFFDMHPEVQWTLIRGNHDTHLRQLPAAWPLEIQSPAVRLGPLCLTHKPGPELEGAQLRLCGHVHPAVRLSEAGGSSTKLPCFWLSQSCLVLPALGEFTGTHVIRLKANEHAWVIAGDSLYSMDPQASSQ